MMTKGNTMAYVITHQLLYFVMVEKSGCVAPIEELVYKYNKTSLRDFEKRLCKSIYVEAQQEEVGNSVKELKQDLFLEQLLLCSLVGFQEFFQEKWIRLVLSWQKPRGCYGMPASLMKVEAELTRVQEDEKHFVPQDSQKWRRAEDSSYFEQFLDTINSPYTFDVKLDSLGDTSGVTPGTDGSYDEVRGDRCLSLILGSYEKNEG
uniref:Uncharacterized protein n=1 Tax=Biomphalaria glabrata TaxID=6526 RepID=A0A2C9LZ26_BIOGL